MCVFVYVSGQQQVGARGATGAIAPPFHAAKLKQAFESQQL